MFRFSPTFSNGKEVCDHRNLRQQLNDHLVKLKKLGIEQNVDFWDTLQTLSSNDYQDVTKLLSMRKSDRVEWFWSIVEKIDWQSDMNVNAARSRLESLHLSNSEQQELYQIAGLFYGALDALMYYKFGYCVPTPGSDDSYSDFIWSAVGQGRRFYESLFSESFDWNSDEIGRVTVESFSYVIDPNE